MSSLCVKIDSLNEGIKRSNTAIIRAVSGVMKERSSHPSILWSTNNTRRVTEDNELSSVARRHAATTRTKTKKGYEVEEGYKEGLGEEDDFLVQKDDSVLSFD